MDKKIADILFLCQFFHPEYNSSATLPFDTAKYLAAHGFAVRALVGYPREYSAERHVPVHETVEGVDINRLKYRQLSRVGTLGRLVNYFSFTLHAFLHLKDFKQCKSVVVYSNPPILPIVPILAKKKYGTKIVFVAYDVYPEVAFASQSIRPGSLISRIMNRINRHLYQTADMVVALTEEMRSFLLKNRPGLTPERVVTIANWAHEHVSRPDHEAYERFGYAYGQFVVSYFGNMGTCQDVETMMEAAELLKDDDRVRFLIVGHGNKKGAVAERIQSKGLGNVQLLDFLTGKEFQQAVAVSSCCIVSLERGLIGTCAPSKYYSYLQGGQPVLAVVEEGSYLEEEVNRERIGHSVSIGDGQGLCKAILSMLENPEESAAMGARAKKLYEDSYSYEIAMPKYAEVLKSLLAENE